MMTQHLSPVASALILVLCVACASQPERRGPPPNERGNGGTSYTGIAAKPISVLFASMDVSRDTVVDADELALGIDVEWTRLSKSSQVRSLDFKAWSLNALGAEDTLPSFIAFDHDLDGIIAKDDFSKQLRHEFNRLDADESSTLTRAELVFRIASRSRGTNGVDSGQRRGGDGRRPPKR